jgi:hypothetical protein
MTQALPTLPLEVSYNDITVVVHGPILWECGQEFPEGMTPAVLQSVRKNLPGAKILISTWEGAPTAGLEADTIVCSADPGGKPYGPNFRTNNVNRQIVAMKSGLNLVQTKWALKLRSDTLLTSNRMVECWGKHRVRHPYLQVFTERIMTSAILTYHPRLCFQGGAFTPWLFHVNDMIQFGLTEDMQKLWGIPLMPEADFTYFTPEDLVDKIDKISNRRVPEDYIWTQAMAAAGFASNDSWADFRPALIPLSELSIVNNFELLDYEDMGFHCLKYPKFGYGHHALGAPFFTHKKWFACYRLYCDPGAKWTSTSWRSSLIFIKTLIANLSLSRIARYIKTITRPYRYRVKHLFKRP